MNNLKIGDTITNGKDELEVVYVSKNKERVAVEDKNGLLFSENIRWFIHNDYTKKETPWVPEIDQVVWLLSGDGEEHQEIWENSEFDRARADFLGVYPDQASAIKAREEVKEFIKTK